MSFPVFLKIVFMPYFLSAEINETTSVEQIPDYYEVKLAEIISQKVGFSYETVIPKDKEWGSLLSGGKWSGMIGVLQRNEADLIISSLSMTEKRSHVIDYSYPYHVDRLVFATRSLGQTHTKYSFLKPFTLEAWMSICGFVLILPVVNYSFIRRIISFSHFENYFRNFVRVSDNTPKRISESLSRISWLILLTLLRWFYAAVLLSFLTFPSLNGVRNIPELAEAVRLGTHECTAFPGAYYADELMDSVDANLKIIGRSLKGNESFTDFVEVMSNKKQSTVPAYLATESHFIVVRKKFFVSEDGLFPDYLAIGIRKDFCCKAELDSAIHDIWASGIYTHLLKEFWRKYFFNKLWKALDVDGSTKRIPLSLAEFQGAFILLAAGYLLATSVFFIELSLAKSRRIIQSRR